jgi:hypothetical protein
MLLVRVNGQLFDPSWQVHEVPLEDIVLAYLGHPGSKPQGNVAGRDKQ